MAQGTANGIDAISAPTDQQPDASTPSSKNAASPNAIPQTPSKSQPRFRTFFRSLRFLAPVVAALMVIISCIAISVTTIVRIQQAIEALGSILQTSIGDFSTNILNATATNQYRSAEFLRNESFVTSVCFRSSPINLAAPDTYKSILQALDQEIRINPNLGVVGCYTRNQVFSLQRTYDNPNIVSASILEVGGVYTHYAYNRQTYVIDNATILATNPDYVPENRSFWKTLVANGGKPVSLDFGITARQRLGMYTYLPMFRSVRDSNSTSAPFDGILLHLVFTDTFTDFIASMRRTPSTIVFMVDNKGRMAGSSEPSLTIKVSNNTATQIPASESSNPVIKEVSNLFGDLLSKSSSGTSSGTHKSVAMDSSSQTLSLNLKVNVRLNGKTWDVQAKTMNQIPNSLANSYVASASPEEELYGASARIPQETTVISAAVIVLFALVSMLLTVPLLQSLQSVVNQMKKLENLDFSDFERGQFKNSSPITEIRAIQETLTAVTKTFAIALQNNRYLFKSSVVKSYCQIENEEIKQV